MEKDVIYIEPEDDITDIITKLKKSPKSLVALVPPKKIGVLRSSVNTKLIAKAAASSHKTAILVTTDQSLMKLAMSAHLPVAKTPQATPIIPTEDDFKQPAQKDLDLSDEDSTPDDTPSAPPKPRKTASASTRKPAQKPQKPPEDASDKKPQKSPAKSKKAAKSAKDAQKKVPSFDKYRKWIVLGVIALICLTGFLIWANVFAPAAKIIVTVRTSTENFSEDVNFVTKAANENAEKGIFLLEPQSIEDKASAEVIPTGEKDVGEKASGTLTVEFSLSEAGSASISKGSRVSYDGLSYTVTSGTSVSWDGEKLTSCDNKGKKLSEINSCLLTGKIDITATESGEKYNTGTHASGWQSSEGSANISKIYNTSSISGGTSKVEKYIQQADVDKAVATLTTTDSDAATDGKATLLKKFSNEYVPIDSSYEVEAGKVVATPAVGETTVSNGKVEITTVYSMYGVKKATLSDYIKAQISANLAHDQKIYQLGDPFIEKFGAGKSGYQSGKLKASAQTGPEVSEHTILERAKGKKIGELQNLKSTKGVSSVKVEPSFFWVTTIPDDDDKITIELTVEES